MTDHPAPGLPPHTVRVSRRARRIRLTVSPRDGLVVVLPSERDRRHVADLLRRHGAWIERALARTAERREHLEAMASAPLPARIDLPAVGASFDVAHHARPAGGPVRVVERDGALDVSVPEDAAEEAVRAALRRWLTRVAKERLVPLFEDVAAGQGLAFTRVTIRAQRSRWGSCSRAGSVSLNRSLLFLAPELARCVMVHELVHTLRHDHSPAFWALMRGRVPEVDRLRRELRGAWRDVPPWAEEPAAR